jgi:DNA invertase Pin-like site-specific DNA recombinase
MTDLAFLSNDNSWQLSIIGGALGGLASVLAMLMVDAARRRRRETPTAQQAPEQAEGTATDPERAIPFDASDVEAIDQAEPSSESSASDRRLESVLPVGTQVIGYVTVESDTESDGADPGWLSIEATCEHSGWQLLEIVRDHEEGRGLDRPGLDYALRRIANREAEGLVIADLHRVSASTADLAALMAWFNEAGAALISLDPPIDTSTPGGRAAANTLIALSRSERERTTDRSRNGPGADRTSRRPAVADRPELVERIAAMRARDMTLQAIADRLNAEGVPTLRGGAKWRPSSIQAALGYRRPSPLDHLPPVRKRDSSR